MQTVGHFINKLTQICQNVNVTKGYFKKARLRECSRSEILKMWSVAPWGSTRLGSPQSQSHFQNNNNRLFAFFTVLRFLGMV